MSELYPYVGITGIKGGRKMEKCVRNISHYGDWSSSSFIKKNSVFPLDVNSSLHTVNIYQSSDVVYKQQLSRFTISARCASEMVIILRIKPQEILEKTPLGV